MIKKKHLYDQNLHKTHLYSSLVPILKTQRNEITIDQTKFPIDIAVEVHHEKVIM